MPEIDARELFVREVRLMVPGSQKGAGERQITPPTALDTSATLTVHQVLCSRSRTRRRRRKRSWAAHQAYLRPVLIVYGTFWIGPALFSVYLSFFDWEMASPQKVFVALENYQRVLTDPLFYISLRNTLVYVVSTVALGTLIGLALALLMQRLPRTREVYRFVCCLPVVTSITMRSSHPSRCSPRCKS